VAAPATTPCTVNVQGVVATPFEARQKAVERAVGPDEGADNLVPGEPGGRAGQGALRVKQNLDRSGEG